MAKTVEEIYEEMKKEVGENNIPTFGVIVSPFEDLYSRTPQFIHFVYANESGAAPGYRNIMDASESTGVINFKNFTFFRTDGIEYEIINNEPARKTVVKVYTTSDLNIELPAFAFEEKIPSNTAFWIEKKFLYPSEEDKLSTITQKPILIKKNNQENENKVIADGREYDGTWLDLPDGKILEKDYSYNMILDTKLKQFNEEEWKKILPTASLKAVCGLIASLGIEYNQDQLNEFVSRVEVITAGASNRVNSTFKIMFRMPRQLVDGLDRADIRPFNVTHTLATNKDTLKSNINLIVKYFMSIKDKVNVEPYAIKMDMVKEANYLSELLNTLLGSIEVRSEDTIGFMFNEGNNFELVGIGIFSSSAIKNPQNFSPSNIRYVDIKTLKSEKILKNRRTVLYFINSDLMAKDIKTNNLLST